MPELQIWRNTGGTSYTKANYSQLPSNTLTGTVAEYNLSTPLEFQEGDILGMYQPHRQNSSIVVYYQERDGPVNYREGSSAQSTVTLGRSDNRYDYPLVTVEISTGTFVSQNIIILISHAVPPSSTIPSMVSSTILESKKLYYINYLLLQHLSMQML